MFLSISTYVLGKNIIILFLWNELLFFYSPILTHTYILFYSAHPHFIHVQYRENVDLIFWYENFIGNFHACKISNERTRGNCRKVDIYIEYVLFFNLRVDIVSFTFRYEIMLLYNNIFHIKFYVIRVLLFFIKITNIYRFLSIW